MHSFVDKEQNEIWVEDEQITVEEIEYRIFLAMKVDESSKGVFGCSCFKYLRASIAFQWKRERCSPARRLQASHVL